MDAAPRSILHADLDAFFASVEQLDDPSLRGRPVLVGGEGRRGVVAAASYEARAFGCRSAMPTAVALRLCPGAVVVRPRGSRYRELSDAVFEILHATTPLVQPVSIDEAFLDVTGSVRLLGPPLEIARSIKAAVRERTGLTISIGASMNKPLAKLASELGKPDGLVEISPANLRAVLDPLPVGRLRGVGPAAEKRLAGLGLRTVGELARYPADALAAAMGEHGRDLSRLARGEDDSPVRTDREARSISHEQTFGHDLEEADAVRAVLSAQAEQVARRLRRHGRLAAAVTVKIRYGDFETITRSASLAAPMDATAEIAAAARALFDAWAASGWRAVRLIGVGVGRLTDPSTGGGAQAGLFDAAARERGAAVDRLTDLIAGKHGKAAIVRGSSLRE